MSKGRDTVSVGLKTAENVVSKGRDTVSVGLKTAENVAYN